MDTKAGQKRKRHGNKSLPRVRYTVLNRLQPNRTIFRDDRSIKASIELDAQPAFSARDQSFGVGPAHAGQVVDIQAALPAKPHALVAKHVVPTDFAGSCDLHASQVVSKPGHDSLKVRPAVEAE